MSHRQGDYYYNEHDINQVNKILITKKKKKLKRKIKVLFFFILLVIIGAYMNSSYSRVQNIEVIGNIDVKTQDIIKQSRLNSHTYYLFVKTSQIADRIKELPLIKKVSVRKDIRGNFTIEVDEAEKIACCVIKEKTYVIDELGSVMETEDKKMIDSLQSSLKISHFQDVELLKKFAKEYVQIPELIKSQTSDIVYSPQGLDTTRLKFLMDNGKILYLRIEDMVDQLKRFDYEAFMTAYSDRCQFSFEGQHVYMKKCK